VTENKKNLREPSNPDIDKYQCKSREILPALPPNPNREAKKEN
jgi:hypothetical protein